MRQFRSDAQNARVRVHNEGKREELEEVIRREATKSRMWRRVLTHSRSQVADKRVVDVLKAEDDRVQCRISVVAFAHHRYAQIWQIVKAPRDLFQLTAHVVTQAESSGLVDEKCAFCALLLYSGKKIWRAGEGLCER